MPFFPAERNKTFVILLRSLAQKKTLGEFPSEPLRSPLAPALRARLRDGAHSQQNNGFVSFAYQTLIHSFLTALFQHITSRPTCQLLLRPLPLRRRAYFAIYC